MSNRRGYILVECLVALAVLSASLLVMQRAMRQTLLVRGQARDYTQARFLLEELVAEVLLQPELVEKREQGRFPGEYDRFSWTRTIAKVNIPLPPPPPDAREDLGDPLLHVTYLGRVAATVSWSRAGTPYSMSIETLTPPGQLYVPPPPGRGG